MPKSRIAIAGFQHETNTFGATTAGMADFEMADSWPGMLHDAEVVTGTKGINLPIAGFIAEAEDHPSIELLPILWCAAEPSAHVEDEAFESITGMIIEGIKSAGMIDGIYLDLHGAMVTHSHDDGEGELLRRLRMEFGNDLPIAVSLDLHANVTNEMVRYADFIDAFRTYPHLDMAKTGARCLSRLMEHLDGQKLFKAFRQVPYLIPLHSQYTGADPCKGLYQIFEDQCELGGDSASILLGFTAADIADAGPSVLSYAKTQQEADKLAEHLLDSFLIAEDAFETELLPPSDAVHAGLNVSTGKPVIIADVQDNPGAGASSDTTGLLKAMVLGNVQSALLGLLNDPEMADLAHKAGVGAELEGALGGRSGAQGDTPFIGRFSVEGLSNGQCAYTGEMYGGSIAELGKCAALKVLDVPGDILVVISSNRSQCLDQAIFTHMGIDLTAYQIIGVKSTVHYRADFEPIASAIIESASPGLFICELDKVPFRNLRKGIRIGPCGRPFDPPAAALQP